MKKNSIIAGIVLCAVIISSACKNQPIFAAIEQEVKLKPASIKGFVYGIVKIDQTLYTSNGNIFYKTFGEKGKWSELKGCPEGRCLSLASDGKKLYGVFEKDGSFTARVYDASKWDFLPAPANTVKFVTGTDIVFAVDTDNKKIYTIVDGSIKSQWSFTSIPAGAAGSYCLLDDGLYNDDGTKVNGGPSSGLKGICKGPGSSVFVFDDTTLHCYTGGQWTSIPHGISAPQSVTYLRGKRLVLISGKNGYGEIKPASSAAGLKDAKTISAGADGSTIPAENYYQYKNSIGKYFLNPIAAFDNGTDGYIVYTCALDTNTKYTGLWGFYNPGQIEWNRE